MAWAPSAVAKDAPNKTVVLFETSPLGAVTSLVFQPVGDLVPAAPVATLAHAPGGHVQGAILDPGLRTVVAIADMRARGDRSWGAALFKMAPGEASVKLADHVYTGTHPVVLQNRYVVVVRGHAGTVDYGADGQQRVDTMRLDRIDASTGSARTLSTYQGYMMFPFGALDGEVLVYRVRPDHADIVAIDIETGDFRPIAASILPFAGNFSVDPSTRSILYTQRDTQETHIWHAKRVSIASGKTTILATDPQRTLFSHAWPGGHVVVSTRGRGLAQVSASGIQPLRYTGRARAASRREKPSRACHLPAAHRGYPACDESPTTQNGMAVKTPPRHPQSRHMSRRSSAAAMLCNSATPPGAADRVVALSQDKRWAIAERTKPGALAVPFAIDVSTGAAARIAVPPRTRVVVAGVVP